MKRILFLLFTMLTMAGYAQYPITSINIAMPANPPANTSDWATVMPPVMITAQAQPRNGHVPGDVQESRILVTIKQGGSKKYGNYTADNAPSAGFTSVVKTWSGVNAVALLGKDYTLPPGQYEFCVQFFNNGPDSSGSGGRPLSNEVCKSFTIAEAQTDTKPITNIGITLSPTPPANTADWGSAMPPVMITAQTRLNNGKVPPEVMASRILVTIKQGGSKKYGSFTPNNAPESGFTTAVKTWSGANAISLLGQDVTLPPGSYELCAQLFTQGAAGMIAISDEKCKPFTIQNTKEQNYNPPVNVTPADKKIFTENEIKTPITFRWTPILPRPQGPVVYKLKVWQLMQGQNPSQAMQSSQPIIEEEVKDQTQFMYRKGWDGKGNWVWQVEATDGQGKVLGVSEATTFSVGSPCSPDYEMLFDSVYCGQDGKVHVLGHIKITPKPTITINTISLTQIKETNFSGADVPTSIILPKALTASGNNYPFSFIINGNMCNKELYIGYNINFTCSTTGQTITLPCGDSKKNIPCCKCTTCDDITFTLAQEKSQFEPFLVRPGWFSDNNHLYLTQPIVVGPPSIKVLQVKAEVVDFYWYVEGDCKKCNSNDYYWGNIITGSTTSPGFNPNGTGGTDDAGIPLPNSHEMDFISSTAAGATFSGNINLQLSLPPQTELSCCKDCFRFCIRYTIVFMENGVCKTCSKVKCYEVKRQHRPPLIIMWPPLNDCGERPVINHDGGVLQTSDIKKN